MNRCAVKPYEGTEKYIFISYCHKDKSLVFPIIERLASDGCRVWYDEGIDPGSEWPEIIARHLNEASICIAFISENSANSHNCRREINFALLKDKPFISIILEEVQLPLGMEMQLSANQAIFKYKLPYEQEFYKKLYEAKILKECVGDLNGITVVPINELSTDKGKENDKDNEIVREESMVHAKKFWIERAKTGERIDITDEKEIKLGRSETMCEYIITGNRTVGRLHAKIIKKDNECYIIDNNSMNKTFINSQEINSDEEHLLKNDDIIHLSNEKFVFHEE